jgi:hypothetical protein
MLEQTNLEKCKTSYILPLLKQIRHIASKNKIARITETTSKPIINPPKVKSIILGY